MNNNITTFINFINDMIRETYDAPGNETLKSLGYGTPFEVRTGKKWVKVFTTHGGKPSSIYCFIDANTGLIYKPATYKAPAKGARADVNNPDSYKNADPFGSWLYRR